MVEIVYVNYFQENIMSNSLNYFLKVTEENSLYYLNGGNVVYFSLLETLLQISVQETNSVCEMKIPEN